MVQPQIVPNQWVRDEQAIAANQQTMAAVNQRVPNDPLAVARLQQNPVYLRNLYGDAVYVSQTNAPRVVGPPVQVAMGHGLNFGLPFMQQMQPPIANPQMAEMIQSFFKGQFWQGAAPGGEVMPMPVRPSQSMTGGDMSLPATAPPIINAPTDAVPFNPMNNVGSAQTKQPPKKRVR